MHAPNSGEGRDCLRQTRILVVDDHDLVRRNMCCLLAAQADFTVIDEAATGLDAIRKAEKLQPDVILLDITMPEPNGLRALPQIREIAPQAKILMVTNHDHEVFRQEAIRAGAHGFLSKANIWSDLVTAIRDVCISGSLFKKKADAGFEPEEQDPLPGKPTPSSAEA